MAPAFFSRASKRSPRQGPLGSPPLADPATHPEWSSPTHAARLRKFSEPKSPGGNKEGKEKDKLKNRMSTAFRKFNPTSPTTYSAPTFPSIPLASPSRSPYSGSRSPRNSFGSKSKEAKPKKERRRSSFNGFIPPPSQSTLPAFNLGNLRRSSLPGSSISFRRGSNPKQQQQQQQPLFDPTPLAMDKAIKAVPIIPAMSPVLEGLGIDVDDPRRTQRPRSPHQRSTSSPTIPRSRSAGSGGSSSSHDGDMQKDALPPRPSSVGGRKARTTARVPPPTIPPLSSARPLSSYTSRPIATSTRPISSVYSNVRPPTQIISTQPPQAENEPFRRSSQQPSGQSSQKLQPQHDQEQFQKDKEDVPPLLPFQVEVQPLRLSTYTAFLESEIAASPAPPPVPSKPRDRQALLKKTLMHSSSAPHLLGTGSSAAARMSKSYSGTRSFAPANRVSTHSSAAATDYSNQSRRSSKRNTMVDLELRKLSASKPLPSPAEMFALRPTEDASTQTPRWEEVRPIATASTAWFSTPPLSYTSVTSSPVAQRQQAQVFSRYPVRNGAAYQPPSPSVYSVVSMAHERDLYVQSLPVGFTSVYPSGYKNASQASSIYDDGYDGSEPPLTPTVIMAATRKLSISASATRIIAPSGVSGVPTPPESPNRFEPPALPSSPTKFAGSPAFVPVPQLSSPHMNANTSAASKMTSNTSNSLSATNFTVPFENGPPTSSPFLDPSFNRPRSRISTHGQSASPIPEPQRSASAPIRSVSPEPIVTERRASKSAVRPRSATPPNNDELVSGKTATLVVPSTDDEELPAAVPRPRRQAPANSSDAEHSELSRAEKGRSFFLVQALSSQPVERIKSHYYDSAASDNSGDEDESVFDGQ